MPVFATGELRDGYLPAGWSGERCGRDAAAACAAHRSFFAGDDEEVRTARWRDSHRAPLGSLPRLSSPKRQPWWLGTRMCHARVERKETGAVLSGSAAKPRPAPASASHAMAKVGAVPIPKRNRPQFAALTAAQVAAGVTESLACRSDTRGHANCGRVALVFLSWAAATSHSAFRPTRRVPCFPRWQRHSMPEPARQRPDALRSGLSRKEGRALRGASRLPN